MKQRRVVTTPEADEDAKRIDQWWIRNRSAARNLFLQELADALALLGLEAGVGVRYAHRTIPGLHRYLWGATRRTTPRFANRAASTKRALDNT
jgi:hypothetical protein